MSTESVDWYFVDLYFVVCGSSYIGEPAEQCGSVGIGSVEDIVNSLPWNC